MLKVRAYAMRPPSSRVNALVYAERLPERVEADRAHDIAANAMSIYAGFISPATYGSGMAVEGKLGRPGMVVAMRPAMPSTPRT